MAINTCALTSFVLVLSLCVIPSLCFNPKSIGPFNNSAMYDTAWSSASATWYGLPTGAGAEDNGGGCGFKNVNLPPFNSMTSCGNHAIFQDGKGCGSCYQVRCFSRPACSGKPSTLTVTDICDGGICRDAPIHFDMSGTLFGSMSLPGKNDELRHAGRIPIQFRRVPCEYPGRKVAFHVEEGSNPVYFAVLIEYEDGDGDLNRVDIMESRSHTQSGSGQWTPMRESWGAIWRLDSNHALQAPFSIRITSDSGKVLVAKNVIPAGWKPKTVYRSYVQYS